MKPFSRLIFLLSLSLFSAHGALAAQEDAALGYAQADIAGTWEAELAVNESDETRLVALEFRVQDDDLTGAMIVGDNPPVPLEDVDVRVQGGLAWVAFRLSAETDERVHIRFIGALRDDRIFFHAMHLFIPEQPADFPLTRLGPVTREVNFTAVRVR